jgi:type IV secretion system protein VirB3
MSSSESYRLEMDLLAVALTRPTLFMGIPIRLFFFNMIFSLLICIDFHTWYGLMVFPILYGLMWLMCAKDPHFLRLWRVFLMRTPPVLNRGFWGRVNSYAPW